jgi:hypothetical protein
MALNTNLPIAINDCSMSPSKLQTRLLARARTQQAHFDI